MLWERGLEALFRRKLHPPRIQKALSSLTGEPFYAKERQGPPIAACVQKEIRPVPNVWAYIVSLLRFVQEAAAKGCALIVFPEYNFFDLFGFLPGFRLMNHLLKLRAVHAPKAQSKYRTAPKTPDRPTGFGRVFWAISKPLGAAVQQIFSELSSFFGIYIFTGSFVLEEDGHLFNAGFLYGPDGKCVGTQKKLHLTDEETEMGLSRGESLQIFDLPFGKAAFPICMDATYFETFRIAAEKGAEIVALPISNGEEYDVWKSLRGIWPRVQESYVFGLKASQNGWAAGMHFTGKAGIFAPLELAENGILALSDSSSGDALVCSSLDLDTLRNVRETAPYFGDSNPAFESGYVDRVYPK